MTTYGMLSAFLDFEGLYLWAYWLERFNFLEICTTRLQLTMSQIFRDRIFFTKKLLAEKNSKKTYRVKKRWLQLTSVPLA